MNRSMSSSTPVSSIIVCSRATLFVTLCEYDPKRKMTQKYDPKWKTTQHSIYIFNTLKY
jgi:hypothetical protein